MQNLKLKTTEEWRLTSLGTPHGLEPGMSVNIDCIIDEVSGPHGWAWVHHGEISFRVPICAVRLKLEGKFI